MTCCFRRTNPVTTRQMSVKSVQHDTQRCDDRGVSIDRYELCVILRCRRNIRSPHWLSPIAQAPLPKHSSTVMKRFESIEERSTDLSKESSEPQSRKHDDSRRPSHAMVLSETRRQQTAASVVGNMVAAFDEPESSDGEGDLASEQSEVMRATAKDETVEDEVNLIG